MVIFMKEFFNYIVSIMALHAFFSIVYMFFIDIEAFFAQYVYNMFCFIFILICGYFLANIVNTIIQFIFGKLKKYECCVLNIYPFYVIQGYLKFSISLVDLVDIRTMYSVHQLNYKNQQEFLSIKEQTKKLQLTTLLVLGIVWLIIAVYFKIYMLILISCTFFGWVLTCMHFKQIKYIQDPKLPLKEAIYSKKIDKSTFVEYLREYTEEVIHYENDPQNLNSIIMFAILFYRHHLQEELLVILDDKVYTLLQKYNALIIPYRVFIYDYFDIRYCLSKDYRVKDYAYHALSEFVEYDWDIKLLPKFISRYSEIKETYSYNQSLQVEKKYNRYFW